MRGMTIGYIRVSAADQNPDRQLADIELDRKFIDYASGSTLDRPEFKAMINFIREGDILKVHSLDRLARNLHDLRMIVDKLIQKKVEVHFLKESLIFTSNPNPMSVLLLSVMGAFAEFERELIRERQKEGIALAKKMGKCIGRPKVLDQDQLASLIDMVKSGKKRTLICKEFGLGRATLYKYLKQAGITLGTYP